MLPAGFSAECGLHSFLEPHSCSFQQFNGRKIPRVGDCDDVVDLRELEQQDEGLTDRFSAQTLPLETRCERKADLGVAFLADSNADPDVTDEVVCP